jgi:hypothetical protein
VTLDTDWHADSDRPEGRWVASFLPATVSDRDELQRGYLWLEQVCWTHELVSHVRMRFGTSEVTRDLMDSSPDESGIRCYDFQEPLTVRELACVCDGPQCREATRAGAVRCEAYGKFDRGPIP